MPRRTSFLPNLQTEAECAPHQVTSTRCVVCEPVGAGKAELGRACEELLLLMTTPYLSLQPHSVCLEGLVSECRWNVAKTAQEPLACGSRVGGALPRHRIPICLSFSLTLAVPAHGGRGSTRHLPRGLDPIPSALRSSPALSPGPQAGVGSIAPRIACISRLWV